MDKHGHIDQYYLQKLNDSNTATEDHQSKYLESCGFNKRIFVQKLEHSSTYSHRNSHDDALTHSCRRDSKDYAGRGETITTTTPTVKVKVTRTQTLILILTRALTLARTMTHIDVDTDTDSGTDTGTDMDTGAYPGTDPVLDSDPQRTLIGHWG